MPAASRGRRAPVGAVGRAACPRARRRSRRLPSTSSSTSPTSRPRRPTARTRCRRRRASTSRAPSRCPPAARSRCSCARNAHVARAPLRQACRASRCGPRRRCARARRRCSTRQPTRARRQSSRSSRAPTAARAPRSSRAPAPRRACTRAIRPNAAFSRCVPRVARPTAVCCSSVLERTRRRSRRRTLQIGLLSSGAPRRCAQTRPPMDAHTQYTDTSIAHSRPTRVRTFPSPSTLSSHATVERWPRVQRAPRRAGTLGYTFVAQEPRAETLAQADQTLEFSFDEPHVYENVPVLSLPSPHARPESVYSTQSVYLQREQLSPPFAEATLGMRPQDEALEPTFTLSHTLPSQERRVRRGAPAARHLLDHSRERRGAPVRQGRRAVREGAPEQFAKGAPEQLANAPEQFTRKRLADHDFVEYYRFVRPNASST